MDNLPYNKGTIKLTWIDPKDYTILNSRMFTNLQDAKLSVPQTKSKGNNFLFFQLSETDGNSYSWKLLPYGKHKEYVNGMKLKDNPIYKFGIPLLALVGGFFIVKEIVKKVKAK
jgi:hypothetical protein|tara:strand:+ start:193 stop:534 length:342 start_codon:yes stop_codon:yes gene_type:complete